MRERSEHVDAMNSFAVVVVARPSHQVVNLKRPTYNSAIMQKCSTRDGVITRLPRTVSHRGRREYKALPLLRLIFSTQGRTKKFKEQRA